MAATAELVNGRCPVQERWCRNAERFDPESPIPRRAILAEPGWGSSTSGKVEPGNRWWQSANRANGPGLRKPDRLPETHALRHLNTVQVRRHTQSPNSRPIGNCLA